MNTLLTPKRWVPAAIVVLAAGTGGFIYMRRRYAS